MEAAQLAAEATVNGAEPAVNAVRNFMPMSKAIAVTTNVGMGFLGVSVAGWGIAVAASSFKGALEVLKG